MIPACKRTAAEIFPLESRRLLASIGQLDPAFADNGIADTGFAGSDAYGTAITVTSEGRPIIAASRLDTSTGWGDGLNLARYNTDGSPDTSFGTQGKTFIPIADPFVIGDAVLQSDGKLLVAGSVAAPGADQSTGYYSLKFIVLRFNSDGSPDASFGTAGSVRTAITSIDPTFAVQAKKIAVSSTGTIAVGGNLWVSGNATHGNALAVYNSSGQLLTSFSDDGLVVASYHEGAGQTELHALAFQPDGKLLVNATAFVAADSSYPDVLTRYNQDGTPDSSFSSDGKVELDLGWADQMIIAPDNKILIRTNSALKVQRINADGSLDTSFGGGDSIAEPAGGAGGFSLGMVLLPNGKIRLGPAKWVQYNADGTPDSSFSATTTLPGLRSWSDVTFDPDGKLIIAGSGTDTEGTPSHYFVARVGRDDVALGSDGTLWVDGTASADTITIASLGNSARLVRNGATTDFTKPVTSIQLDLLGGNDTGTITLNVPAHVEGGAGNDSITTAAGNDTITDSAGDDTILTGAGDDSVIDTNGSDSIVTAAGDDHVIVCIVTRDPDPEIPPVVGSITAATISTGDGNDIVVAGGTIHATLGAGNDQYSSPSSTSTAQYVDAADGNDSLTISSNGADTILAGTGDDRIISYGTVGKQIDAGDGNDLVVASAGSTILGGAGNDLVVSSGSVSIHGGDGDDRISVYTAAGQSATIYGEDGMDSIMTGDGNDSIVGGANKDNIHSGNGDDTVRGYGGNDKIFGAGGDDLLCGAKGNDRIDGGDGNDTLWGNAGTNRLSGNAGDDMIWARNSLPDTLDGGEGFNSGIFDGLLDTVTSVVSV